MKIAVIGSGISGLAACFFLKKNGHHVTLIEKSDRLGMDQFWAAIPENDPSLRCDVPPRMFQSTLWPNLVDLYSQASISTTKAESGRSYSIESQNPFLRLDQSLTPVLGFHLLGKIPRNILSEIKRLQELVRVSPPGDFDLSVSMHQFLLEHKFGGDFIYKFLYPSLSSTVCTCDFPALDRYPAKVLLEGMQNLQDHAQLMRSAGGTEQVARKLSADADQILLGNQVTKVTPTGGGQEVIVEVLGQEPLLFDHAILATEPQTAIQLTHSSDQPVQEHLSAFTLQKVPVCVHSDQSLMPPNKKHWEAFNMISEGDSEQSDESLAETNPQKAMCSIWLNRFYGWRDVETDYFQTIFPLRKPADHLIVKSSVMNRAVVTEQSVRAANRIQELQQMDQDRKIWYCGSYLTDQIPLLESGVESAKVVASCINKTSKLLQKD